MKRLYAIVFLILLVVSLSFGETVGFLGGHVVDKKTGFAVKSATIVVSSINRNAKSDGDGFFFVGDLPAGTYAISCICEGCRELTKQVTVRANAAVSIEIEMLRLESSNAKPDLNTTPPAKYEPIPPDTGITDNIPPPPPTTEPVNNYPVTNEPSFYEPLESFYGPSFRDQQNGQREGITRSPIIFKHRKRSRNYNQEMATTG